MVAFVGLGLGSTLSGLVKGPALSGALTVLAAASGVWLWWALRELPIKNKGFMRAFCLILAASALLLNALRWLQWHP